jgi:hypothetical protein
LLNQGIKIPMLIDKKNDTLFFDTGADDYLFIIDTTIPNKDNCLKIIVSLSSKTKIMYAGLQMTNTETESGFLKLKNREYHRLYIENIPCKPFPVKTIIDLTPIYNSYNILNIDLDSSLMCFYDTINAEELNSFFEVKLLFKESGKRRQISIFLTIAGEEQMFLYDKVNTNVVLIIKKSLYKNRELGDTIFEGVFGRDIHSVIRQDAIYRSNVSVGLNK